MLARLLATLAIVPALLTLPACDAPVDEAAGFRAITVTDTWGIHDPWHAPDVNSCEDYWNDRCAGVSAQECGVLRARYSCESSDQGGVVLTDRFGDATAAPGQGVWRVFTPGLGDFSAGAATPIAACDVLPKKQRPACQRLAKLAALGAEVQAIAPAGGIAPVLPVDEIDDTLPLPENNLLLDTLAGTDWDVPALPHDARLFLGESLTIRDDVLLVAPDGSTIASSKDIVLLRDVRCTMDKVEVCVDVDVK